MDIGTVTATPHTYYTTPSGYLIIPDEQGNFALRQGSLGRFESTDKMLVTDPETGLPLKIVQPSHIDKTNISIQNIYDIVIDGSKSKIVEAEKPEARRIFKDNTPSTKACSTCGRLSPIEAKKCVYCGNDKFVAV